MSVIGSATLRLLGDASKFSAEMQAAGNRFQAVGKKMQGVGRSMSTMVTVPILGAGAAIVKTGADFEAEMSKIVGLVGISQEQVDAWSKELIRMGPALGKSPQELAEALFFVTSAGYEGAAALDVLTLSAKASSAGLGDTATVADAVTSAVNAYGPEILSASDATDILTAAVREGKLEASALAPVLGTVLPTASALGISFEDVAGQLAVLSRTGTDAANGATQLNAVMSFLMRTSSESAKILDEENLSLAKLREQAAGPGGLISVMRTLNETYGGNVDTLAAIVPNTRAFRGVMTNLAQKADVVDGVLGGVADSTGALDKAFQAAEETARFKLNASMAELKGSLVTMGNSVIPPVTAAISTLASGLAKVAEFFSSLPEPVQKAVTVLTAVVAAAGPLVLIAGKLVSAWGLVASAFPVVAGVIAAIGWPVTLAIAAITALILVGRKIIANWDEIKAAAEWWVEAIKGILVKGMEYVADKIMGPVRKVKEGFAWLSDVLVGHSIVPDMMKAIDKEFGGLNQIMAIPADEAAQKVNAAFRNIVNPEALRAMDFDIDLDADDLYAAVIQASGSAKVAIDGLSRSLPPPASALMELYREIETTRSTTRDWAGMIEEARLKQLDLHHAMLTQEPTWYDINDKMKDWGQQTVEMSAAGQAGMDRYRASLEEGRLMNEIYIQTQKTMDMASQEVSYKFQNLQRSAASVIADFSPLGMLAQVFQSALKALEPAISALKQPLEIIGTIIGKALTPVLEAIWPIFKFLAIVTTYVLEGFFKLAGVVLIVVGWLQKAIGSFVHGLGKLLSKIPLIGGFFKPLKKAGKLIKDQGEAIYQTGKAFMEAGSDMPEARAAIEALQWPADAEAAADEQVTATDGTTSAIEDQTGVMEDGVDAYLEVLTEIRDGILTIRDILTSRGGALGRPAGVMEDSTLWGLAGTDNQGSVLGTHAGISTDSVQSRAQIDVAPGAVVIKTDGPVTEADGRAAAGGFMDELSGENFSRTKRLVTGSGQIDAPLAVE